MVFFVLLFSSGLICSWHYVVLLDIPNMLAGLDLETTGHWATVSHIICGKEEEMSRL